MSEGLQEVYVLETAEKCSTSQRQAWVYSGIVQNIPLVP